jgi:hypothetical protein
MDTLMKIDEFVIEVFTIQSPSHTVNPGRGLPHKRKVRHPKKLRRDMVK